MAITSKVKEELRSNQRLRLNIAMTMGVGERSVMNWIANDSIKLETDPVVALIKKETGLTKSEIIEPANATA